MFKKTPINKPQNNHHQKNKNRQRNPNNNRKHKKSPTVVIPLHFILWCANTDKMNLVSPFRCRSTKSMQFSSLQKLWDGTC